MAQYPNSANLDWTDSTVPGQGDELVDQQDVNFAEHVNEIRDEVRAIAAELGSNPRGAQSSVRTRLENIETTKSGTGHNHDSAYVLKATLAAKGNILTATGAGIPAVLSPGTNGTVVMYDSAQPTGLKTKALDHGDDLSGKGDDDHPQYHNNARHDARNHAGIPGVPPYPFVGMVVKSARTDVPAMWLECRGQAVSRTTYADLFAAIGTQYGTGDGSTTFNLPDARGRFDVGLDSTRTAYDTVGKSGGAETVILSISQIPSHDHTTPSHSHTTPNHSHGSGTLSTNSTGSHSHTGSAVSISNHEHQPSNDLVGTFTKDHEHNNWGGTPTIAASPIEGRFATNMNWDMMKGAGGHGHSLSINNSVNHSHSVNSGSTANANPTTHNANPTTNTTGGGGSHENMPPFIVFRTLIFAGA